MPDDRLLRILARFRAADERIAPSARLCEVCADVLDMSGAGVMLMSGNTPRGSVCSSNDVSALIEDLQFTLGEGPCIDAFKNSRPILEPDLADPSTSRWMAFSPLAIAGGVRAIFGFPVHVGSVSLGALNLYRDSPGPLSENQLADALVVAEVAARAVLDMEAHAAPGMIPTELNDADFRYVVHQAAGMASVQLEVSVNVALIRLRAYAFANERPLTEVSEDIVARRLRFG